MMVFRILAGIGLAVAVVAFVGTLVGAVWYSWKERIWPLFGLALAALGLVVCVAFLFAAQVTA